MSALPELEQLSALIDFVYQGATDPARWPDIVAGASDWLGSPKGMLYTPLHGPERGGFYFQHGLSDAFLEMYKARYQSVDMWTQQVVQRNLFTEGNVILGTDLVPHATLVESPWYRDCLEMGDISKLLTSVVFAAQGTPADARISDMPTACSFYRRSGDEHYGEDEQAQARPPGAALLTGARRHDPAAPQRPEGGFEPVRARPASDRRAADVGRG